MVLRTCQVMKLVHAQRTRNVIVVVRVFWTKPTFSTSARASCTIEIISLSANWALGSGSKGEGGLGGLSHPPPLPFWIFFFTKAKFTSKTLVLNEYEICLKMLKMVILETKIFKSFWGSMPPGPPTMLAPSESPGSAPGKQWRRENLRTGSRPFTIDVKTARLQ